MAEEKISKRISELLEQLHLPEKHFIPLSATIKWRPATKSWPGKSAGSRSAGIIDGRTFWCAGCHYPKQYYQRIFAVEVLKNKTIVLVTHDIREAFELGDRILLMDKGKIVQQGKAIELLFHPKTGFVSDFFSSQKMQLELHVVYLKDIFAHLENEKGDENDFLIIDENKSLWETIELLQTKNKNTISVKDGSSGEIKQVGYNSLFTGLEALKQQNHE